MKNTKKAVSLLIVYTDDIFINTLCNLTFRSVEILKVLDFNPNAVDSQICEYLIAKNIFLNEF